MSDWMKSGNVNQIVKAHSEVDPLGVVGLPSSPISFGRQLKTLQLASVAKVLIYLYDNEMVYRHLKGARFLSSD